MNLRLSVNGEVREVDVSPYRRLLDVLRVDLGLTGTKEGCGEGECGACSVLCDGEVVNSCLIAAGQAEGHAITTIEGLAALAAEQARPRTEGERPAAGPTMTLAAGGTLTDIQDALIGFGGTQCGICTPGIALCASRVLAAEPEAPRARLRELLSGNICRCTGYQLIVDALVEVAERRRGAAR